jgi:hypothetical protein
MFTIHREHYWFCSDDEYSDIMANDYLKNFGIQLISYSSKKNHEELTNIIHFFSN